VPRYRSDLWRAASKDRKAHWTVYKILLQVTGPLIATIAGLIVTTHNTAFTWHVIAQALACGLVGLLLAYLLTWLLSLVRAPRLVYVQQLSDIKDRDSQIQERDTENQTLRERLAESVAVKAQADRQPIRFDCHIEVDTKGTTRRSMATEQPGNPIDTEIPSVYLVITNKGQCYMTVVRYRINDAPWSKIGHGVSSNASDKFDITGPIVEHLIANAYPQAPVHSTLAIAVECLGDEDSMPPIAREKRFVGDVHRTRARNNMAGLMMNIQPE